MENKSSNPPRTSKRWLRLLGAIMVAVVVIGVVGYFVVTSSPFFKGVILPKVGASLNAEVTVSSVSLSPFSQVTLHDLTVTPKGAEPLLTAKKVTARYKLMDIIGGKIVVHEATVDSPVITVVENADGTSNLDPIVKGTEKSDAPADSKKDKDSEKPAEVRIDKIAINNGLVRITKRYAGEDRDTTEISNLNFSVEDVQNGKEGKMTLAAQLKVNNHPPSPATNGTLEGSIAGNFTFKLTANLQPDVISGQTRILIPNAAGNLTELRGLSADLNCDISPTEIKTLALKLKRNETALGEVRASGPFDLSKNEGQITIVLLSVDRGTLNLFGGAKGMDFGDTTLTATNEIKIAQGGSLIETAGQLHLNRFSVKQQNQVTPAVDLELRFQTTVDRKNQLAHLQTFTLDGRQNGKPLLHGTLTSPMQIALSGATNSIGDSALAISVTNLNLADWRPLLGETVTSGSVGADLSLTARQAGQGITLKLKSHVADLSSALGTNRLSQVDLNLGADVEVTGMEHVKIDQCRLELRHRQNPVLEAVVRGVYHTRLQTADLQFQTDNSLPALLSMLPQPGVAATSGSVHLHGRLLQTNTARSVRADLQLREFSGVQGESKFTNFTTWVNLDVTADEKLVVIHGMTAVVTNGGAAGGKLTLSGNYDPITANFAGTLKLDDFNQNALEPFLAGALGQSKLVSVSLNGSASTRYAPQGPSSVDADIKLANLVVHEPEKPKPNAPLAAQLRIDVSQQKENLELRQVRIALSPTDRAKNELNVTGHLNLAQTNATEGNIKIAAESLDLTPYYDLFADPDTSTNAPPTEESPTPSPSEQTTPSTEPPATTLPLRNFALEVDVGAFYLRDIEIKKWRAKTLLDGSNVVLDPFQLDFNGAPISATVKANLGVPGYRYDLLFDVAKLPIEPLANTFLPEKRGMYKGDFITQGRIQGLGTTGPNVRQHLNGQLGFSFTNAALQILSPKLKKFLTPIALVLGVPDVMKSPITFLNIAATAGEGKINMSRLTLASAVFLAETQGEMPVADDLMKSPIHNWPVAFSLRRALAESIRAIPKETNSVSDYVRLPDFIKVVGTLGEPNAKLDKLALTGSILEKYADKIPGLDNKTGNLLKGLGGLIGGNKGTNQSSPGTTNSATTNQPAAPKFNPFDLLKKPKK